MEDKSGLINENDFMLKSRLEVKLNDLEKKHLETKEREAQTVGFLERKLRQVELEHKTELKLRRQLRYEVNNLRKKLLETYQLYSNTLEHNELMRSEIDRLKGSILKSKSKQVDLTASKQVEIEINESFQHDYCFNNENSRLEKKNRSTLRGSNEFDLRESKLSMSFDARSGRQSFNRGSLLSKKNLFSSINRTAERIKIPSDGRTLGKAISGNEISRDLNLKSERAKDWLNQIEELYKPLEYPKLCNRMYKTELDQFSGIGAVESSLNLGEDSFSDEECYSDEYDISENAEDVITNTGFIIDQINQQDKELSTLLNKTFISTNNKSRTASKNRLRNLRNNRK
ncbi:uncharacterized protein ELE39_002445 [Cryptosporidium sp. chipmunk genotype I]|uniref:uncharacterized protein n=1 Tax=Cryptosporidium sp. chipmunk genotype I TaxID=1280935 RepID=UPI003519F2E8|nr:hypothetical protein ELE39_002445 [Cryptosporidium sp. chipmunk genotype I]